MNISMNYDDIAVDIDGMLSQMARVAEEQEQPMLRKIGETVKGNVIKQMKRSDVEVRAKLVQPSNYDHSRPYVHMADEVLAQVKKSALGYRYVTIKGGKYTGYKWHYVSDGWTDKGRIYHQGNAFIGKALAASETPINGIIDSYVQKVTT